MAIAPIANLESNLSVRTKINRDFARFGDGQANGALKMTRAIDPTGTAAALATAPDGTSAAWTG